MKNEKGMCPRLHLTTSMWLTISPTATGTALASASSAGSRDREDLPRRCFLKPRCSLSMKSVSDARGGGEIRRS